jgi:DNA-directed RNA polymerase specialized sigma24 family protein
VRQLPVKQRAAVTHRFVLDLAYAEIAARMGTSEEAARQNVSAGLRRLRREVTDDR